MRKLIAFCIVLFALTGFSQEGAKLERTVNGHVLKSGADPAVSLTIAPSFAYVGGQVIDIFHVAGAEQYFFVEAGPDKSVNRFYWIQFEHYYPDNSHAYDYSGIGGQQAVKLGTLEFLADTKVSKGYFTADNRAGSDSESGRELLASKGYKLDGTFVRTRMFHLPDASKRKELMIIYGEALPAGTSDEKAKSDVFKRAQESLKIE